MINLDSILKSRDITLSTKVRLVKAMVFPVFMYGCESWTIKKAECWRIDAFELWCWRRLLRVPWTARRSKPVHPKGDQSWVFIGKTDAEAEILILWPPDAKNWLVWQDPDAGKDWGQEEKRMTEYEMAGWHHQLNGHGFGWTLGVGGGQGGLACCGSWVQRESDMTEQLNWTPWYSGSMFLSFTNQFRSVAQLFLTLFDPMDCSTPGFPVHHQLPEFAWTHVHRVGDAEQPSHPLLSPPPAFSLCQHQGLF